MGKTVYTRDLIEEISDIVNVEEHVCEDVLRQLKIGVKRHLLAGDRVVLRGLVTFDVVYRTHPTAYGMKDKTFPVVRTQTAYLLSRTVRDELMGKDE